MLKISSRNRLISRRTHLACTLVLVLIASNAAPETAQAQSDSPRATVQGYSLDIREVLEVRPYKLRPSGDLVKLQAFADQRLTELESARDPAYQALVLEQRPEIKRISTGGRFFRVPVNDFDGNVHWMTGEIPAVWHLRELDPAVFRIAETIALQPQNLVLPANTRIRNALLLGGTALQSMAHAYPGDFDYNESFVLEAHSIMETGEIMAAAIAEFVGRSLQYDHYEFVRLRVMPEKSRRDAASDYTWNAQRIMDPAQRSELARQLTTIQDGRMNTDWRALAAHDRFFIIGKIFYFDAFHVETGELLLQTEPIKGNYQTAYFGRDVPEIHKQRPLGEHAQNMQDQVHSLDRKDHYLKAAKRSFNYCRVIGDLDCLDAVIPVFATQAARAYHSHKVLEALVEALSPKSPTRIIRAENAREQLLKVADVIEESLPVPTGTLPGRPTGIAAQLRAAAPELQGDENGILLADEALSARLQTLDQDRIGPGGYGQRNHRYLYPVTWA